MRVISGHIKGRKLKTIAGPAVRPTSDRVKEALFSILAHKPHGARVLDLFAGSGALGIEAISRGAQSAVFVDASTNALKVLRQNLEHCRITEYATVIQWNIQKNLNCLTGLAHTFDLVFMDPPYGLDLVTQTLEHLASCNRLDPGVTIVAEHESGLHIDTARTPLMTVDSRRYGNVQLSIFELA